MLSKIFSFLFQEDFFPCRLAALKDHARDQT